MNSTTLRASARSASALIVSLAIALGALLTGTSATASAATSVEQTFTDSINKARAAQGLPQLATRASLVSVARSWAQTMAGEAKLYHNPSLTSQVTNWRWVGENVGYGPDALTVHVAFMNSPGHRANILDSDYTEVGVGAVTVNGRVWVAEVFRRPMTAASASTSTAASPTRTARPTSAATVAFTKRLGLGSKGAAVKKVQARLGLAETGFYGRPTKDAVSRFQKRQGWAGHGTVGRRTWSRMF